MRFYRICRKPLICLEINNIKLDAKKPKRVLNVIYHYQPNKTFVQACSFVTKYYQFGILKGICIIYLQLYKRYSLYVTSVSTSYWTILVIGILINVSMTNWYARWLSCCVELMRYPVLSAEGGSRTVSRSPTMWLSSLKVTLIGYDELLTLSP